MFNISSIIARHLRHNILLISSAIILVILFIIFGNSFALVLDSSAEQNLDFVSVLKLVLIKGTADLSIIITFATISAITITINSLYKNSEISALHNAGVGNIQLFIWILPLLLVISMINLSVNTLLLPELKILEKQIIAQNSNTTDFNFIKKNTFQNFKGGDVVIYNSSKNEKTPLGETFIYDENNDNLVLANTIERTIDVNNKVYALVNEGEQYSKITGNNNTVAQFDALHLQIFETKVKNGAIEADVTTVPTLQLLSGNAENIQKYQAEFQSRISMSIAIFIIAFIAIILAKTKPKAKYNFALLFSTLFFVLYTGILESLEELIANGQFPHTFGMYSFHAIVVLCIGIWLSVIHKRI